jgi:hypothetical protein
MAKITIFIFSCLLALVASFYFGSEKRGHFAAPNFQGFPKTFEGRELKQLSMSETEKVFMKDFPGKFGRFTDGQREIILRFVWQATRQLHPATDCFKGLGYETKPLPLKIDNGGKRWSCFYAAKNNERLRVCERIYDDAGNEWTDVSSWYWSALDSPSGEWWAITVAERDDLAQ